MTDIYLAYSNSGEARVTFKSLAAHGYKINLLVSYVYLEDWHKTRRTFTPTRTILDSGAFSAWKSGKTIDIEALINETKSPEWGEAVALDVIGDAEASMKNALYMKSKGSPAYPVFHINDPFEMLTDYCQMFTKVGLSCRFGEPVKTSLRWLDQCFARAYPHKFHSFGWVAPDMLESYPFHSADTASWNNAPAAFGNWRAFGKMSVRRTKNLHAEVDYYLKLQTFLKHRWAIELQKLESGTSGASLTRQ